MDYRKHIDAEHRFAGINALWMNGKELFIQAVEIIDGKRVDYVIQYKMDIGNADEKVLFYE